MHLDTIDLKNMKVNPSFASESEESTQLVNVYYTLEKNKRQMSVEIPINTANMLRLDGLGVDINLNQNLDLLEFTDTLDERILEIASKKWNAKKWYKGNNDPTSVENLVKLYRPLSTIQKRSRQKIPVLQIPFSKKYSIIDDTSREIESPAENLQTLNDHASATLTVIVRNVYLKEKEFGLLLECKSIKIHDNIVQNPEPTVESDNESTYEHVSDEE